MNTFLQSAFIHRLGDKKKAQLSFDSMASRIREADAALARMAVDYGGLKKMHFTPSSLLVTTSEMGNIEAIAKAVHAAVEVIIDKLNQREASVLQHFSQHKKFLPYLRKVGSYWQGFSRYDFLTDHCGHPKFLEFNTCCPGGYQYVYHFNSLARRFHHELGVSGTRIIRQSFDFADSFAAHLCQMEKDAGIDPGLVAILYDENELMIELEMIRNSFERLGRRSIVVDARSLIWDGANLLSQGEKISMTFNKFRIAGDGVHCWRDGFESRYEALLMAMQANAMLAVNNFGAMVFAEDKGILEILSTPEWCEQLGIDASICKFIPWTRRLAQDVQPGTLADLGLRKDNLVLKPANEGRGMGVVIGRDMSQSEWDEAIKKASQGDYVVQEYIAPVCLPVIHARDGSLVIESMYQTSALYMINGRSGGLLSRVSSNRVTNVGVSGFIQPTLVIAP